MTDNPVDHPRHYTSHPSGVEAIEVGRHLTADWFNAFKYVFRADHKNGVQDIEKALWYAKDAVAFDFPVHAPSWRIEHEDKLTRIIWHEGIMVREKFFEFIRVGDGRSALACIERMLEVWTPK